jgi:PAS domain S-box-containing protein
MSARVLVVDDDRALLAALPETITLRMPDVVVETCDSGATALELIDSTDYDAVISDIKMPGMDGIALLEEIGRRRPRTPTLLITGHGDRELAVQALRGGAYDFIQKPIDRDYFVASLTRAVERRRLERETERQRVALEQHARVLEHVGDGVFLVGADGEIELWNQAAAAITGLRAERVVGRPAADVFPGWAEVEPLIPVSGAPGTTTEGAKTIPIELEGRETWLSVTGVEFDDGIVYAFHSLSSERALDELRDEFVATVSHELKTPLAAIYGAAATLRSRGPDLDDRQREPLLDMIAGESDRLAQVVNDILVAGQLDQGRLRIETESVDPIELVRLILHRNRGRAVREVELVASPPLPPVRADPVKLQQVLENLLENAIKYSPPDTRVELILQADDHHVRFAVRDRGFGIPKEELRRIFSKFYRLDPQLTHGVGGTGLGLYIGRELVHRMGGRISVTSHLGHGSTFTVALPVAVEERAPTAAARG